MQDLFFLKSHPLLLAERFSPFAKSTLSFALVLGLIFAQALSLNHSHSDDIRDQVDCEICLKVGSSDDMLASDSEFSVTHDKSSPLSNAQTNAVYTVFRTAPARAPPHA